MTEQVISSVREASVNTNFAEEVYPIDTDDDEAEEVSKSDCENVVDGVGDEEPLCCHDVLLPFTGKLLPISTPTSSKPNSPKPSTFPQISRAPPSDPPDLIHCCGDCQKQFSGQAKPTQCNECGELFHKTRCLKSHSCGAFSVADSKSHSTALTK